jgi:hypothetical protein
MSSSMMPEKERISREDGLGCAVAGIRTSKDSNVDDKKMHRQTKTF